MSTSLNKLVDGIFTDDIFKVAEQVRKTKFAWHSVTQQQAYYTISQIACCSV